MVSATPHAYSGTEQVQPSPGCICTALIMRPASANPTEMVPIDVGSSFQRRISSSSLRSALYFNAAEPDSDDACSASDSPSSAASSSSSAAASSSAESASCGASTSGSTENGSTRTSVSASGHGASWEA